MKRWALYLSLIGFLLFALAVGGLNVLYRWKVKPLLTDALAVQERYHAAYEEDVAYLNRTAKRLGYNNFERTKDAGAVLNGKVAWTPNYEGSKYANLKPLVDEQTKIEVLRLRSTWIQQIAKGRKPKVDLSFFEGLNQFDYWDIETQSPIEELAQKKQFVPPTRLPIPDTSDLVTLAKFRLIEGGLSKNYLPALQDVRALAQLLMTTENMQLVLAGIVLLDHERTAHHYYRDELDWKDSGLWTSVDRNVTRRAHRAVLASRGYLRLWTKPDRLQKYFMSEEPPVGFCAAVNEAMPFDFALRRVLEPHLPFEVDTRAEYARLDRILLKARSKCRLKYLSTLAERRRFRLPVPGPFFLTTAPYSRKIFGMRLSAVDLGGFESYGKQLSSPDEN